MHLNVFHILSLLTLMSAVLNNEKWFETIPFVNHLPIETGWSMAVEMLNQKGLMLCSVRVSHLPITRNDKEKLVGV